MARAPLHDTGTEGFGVEMTIATDRITERPMPTEIAQAENTIQAPPDAVWRALTTPESLRQFYFGSEISADWRVGGSIRFRGEWKGKTYEDHGTIQLFDPPGRLAYTHFSPLSGKEDRPENYNLVTFALRPVAGGTAVRLTQSVHDGAEPPTEQARAEFTKNWAMLLEGLKRTVEA